ncbi:MAG TPA: beta-aspartyl-peptidase, partial [Chitinophagaceae bacterium]|nr:beta-aspartyl-peptidase [Chitinophagaceae bacterium]
MSKFTLAIHGGAGTIVKSMLTPELETRYKQGLYEALNAGYQLLHKGENALDA